MLKYSEKCLSFVFNGKNDLIFYDVDFVVYFYMYNGFYKCIICSINILKK